MEEEINTLRAQKAELVAALERIKSVTGDEAETWEEVAGWMARQAIYALARAESATPTKHPDTERLDAIEDGGLDVFESHGEWYVGAAEPCRTLRAALDTARKQGGAA